MDSLLKNLFIQREPDAKKGDFGRLLVIGGSKMYTGAQALAALAGLYSGCDIVVIVAPKRAADTCASISPNLITYPLEGDFIEEAHIKEIESLIDKSDAIIIGPGIGEHEKTKKAVLKILQNTKKPTVIDADALKAIAGEKEILKGKPFIITPNRGEFKILAGKELSKENARSLAKDIDCVVLAKGPIDIITDGKKTEENSTGNPYMTVGGTGDVLAGVAGALLARGVEPFDAASLATLITGRAGDIAAAAFGESLTATDLIDSISQVLMEAKGE